MFFIWKRSPLLRVVLPLFSGVMIAGKLPQAFNWICAVSVFFFMLVVILMLYKRNISFNNRHIIGIIFLLSFLTLGIGLFRLGSPDLRRTHFVHFIHESLSCRLRIKDAPSGKDGSYRCIAEVVGLLSEKGLRKTSGLIAFQFRADSSSVVPSVDDIVWVRSVPDSLNSPLNPGEFDYSSFLHRKGILRRLFASSVDWRCDSKSRDGTFSGWFVSIRESLLASMRDCGLEGDEYAVLAALLLGKTTDIDKELMLSYSGAGAVHILAVSGLHVALVYMIMAPLFSRFFPRKRFTCVKTLIPVILLWTYAGITGFSPSVLRAALMFTCFIVAENYQKDNNIYNTIGASVLMLLLWSPMIAFETGFQLSYLAVLGIVILQKRILSFYVPTNKLMSRAWKLCAVSIAAQIGTLPFTLYYFDQFPVWFLLTNLLVIPLSTVILYCGLGSFALLWWPDAAKMVMGLSGLLTRLMNDTMLLIEKLPLAVIDHIHLQFLDFIFFFGLVIWLCRWILWYHATSLKYALAAILLLLVSSLCFKLDSSNTTFFCLHSIRNGDAISVRSGNSMVMFTDSLLRKDRAALRFHFQTYQTEQGIREMHYLSLDSLLGDAESVVMLFDKKVCLMNEVLLKSDSLPEADYYYFGSWLKMKMGFFRRPEKFLGKHIFFSASFSVNSFSKWKNRIPDAARCYHLRNGALIFKNGS